MAELKVGIIGIGNMGTAHAKNLAAGQVKGAELVAVCDINQQRLDWAAENLAQQVKLYSEAAELLNYAELEAVIIATPHYDHPPLAIAAFEKGLHVLTEKPAGVYTKAVREMNKAALAAGKTFAIMYNQRTRPIYQKVKDLVSSGELGDLKRINWIIDWYRPQSYYDNGGWRATWQGEGGGVLLNQDPHQLDLWQWICGMPIRIRAFAAEGKYHQIEVEDDVTAYFEYENGATGVLVTSTGIAPETNRLEITGTKGKIIVEAEKLIFKRLRISEPEFNNTFKGGFGKPECWQIEIPTTDTGAEHLKILNNWVAAIQQGTKLIAPGEEGIKGLTISNAIHLSAWNDDWVEIPYSEDLFYQKLQTKIANSSFEKKTTESRTFSVEETF